MSTSECRLSEEMKTLEILMKQLMGKNISEVEGYRVNLEEKKLVFYY